MSSNEEQQEELEVLQSIYDGDDCYKGISDSKFQYKYGEEGSMKSLIVEVTWPAEYPEVLPEINLDVFYNKHVAQHVKDAVIAGLTEQANDLLGMSMTYTLFEWVKDNLDSVLSQQPAKPVAQTVIRLETPEQEVKKDKEKKENLTKNQKKRMYDKFGSTVDRPRGWDWIDIIKHLAQTGASKHTTS